MPTTEELLRIREQEIETLREKERQAFYSEVRQSLSDIRSSLAKTNESVSSVQTWVISMGSTTDIKATLDDYKIFKAQIKTALLIMNAIWAIATVLVGWFLHK